MSTTTHQALLGDVKSPHRGLAITFARVYLTLWAFTLGSAVVLGFAPLVALAQLWVGSRLQLEPHAIPSLAQVAATFTHNAAVAGFPLVFVALRFERDPQLQDLGSALLGASIVLNTALVGAASAAGGERLVPYLIHLPVEWAAIAIAGATWMVACRIGVTQRQLTAATTLFVILLAIAAALETYAVPHL